MTPFLILTRAAIIGWTTLAVFPLEMAFDVIEGELERRGVEPWTRCEPIGWKYFHPRARTQRGQPPHHCLD